MEVYKLKDMKGGWIVGDFFPVVYRPKQGELSVKRHPKNQKWEKHLHKKAVEVNILIRGRMIICGQKLKKGDVFVIKKNEIAEPQFLTNCEIVCFKSGSYKNDKYIVK